MSEYVPDIPDAKALYFRGQQREYVLVETQDGAASLYYQGRKIATFANLSAGYKGWGRAVRRWAEIQKSCPDCIDVVQKIIEEQLETAESVSKHFVIYEIQNRVPAARLHTKAMTCNCATDESRTNIRRGAEKLFRDSIRHLTTEYQLRNTLIFRNSKPS